jgi:hypothetical protein
MWIPSICIEARRRRFGLVRFRAAYFWFRLDHGIGTGRDMLHELQGGFERWAERLLSRKRVTHKVPHRERFPIHPAACALQTCSREVVFAHMERGTPHPCAGAADDSMRRVRSGRSPPSAACALPLNQLIDRLRTCHLSIPRCPGPVPSSLSPWPRPDALQAPPLLSPQRRNTPCRRHPAPGTRPHRRPRNAFTAKPIRRSLQEAPSKWASATLP